MSNRSISQLHESAMSGKLVVVLGAGSSLALAEPNAPAKSWTGLIRSGLEYALLKGRANASQTNIYSSLLDSEDLDDLLGVAEFVRRKLEVHTDPLFERWLQSEFDAMKPVSGPMSSAISHLVAANIPLATTNYDTLLESLTEMPSVTLRNLNAVMGWSRRDQKGIFHLHGVWREPSTCVLGIRDYAAAVGSESRAMVQRALTSFNRLLFVGCGSTLEDPNLSSLIEWTRENMGAANLQHYALVTNSEVAHKHVDPQWSGFVEPIGYGDSHSELPGFIIENLAKRVSPRERRRSGPGRKRSGTAKADVHSEVLRRYKEFLIRDCGEMSMEGTGANLAISQRKFDLERLFVPLEVSPVPPELPASEPAREERMRRWRKENPDRQPFAGAFTNSHRMALLALPGGGKTLLLKRLAVAYSSATRRVQGSDDLPELDLCPVMIRCREWKEHIRKPIPVLLQSIPSITGESDLEGLSEALETPLKTGKVLLLVDGLDEIHNDADRTVFVEHLEKFIKKYPKARLLITSREAGFDLVAPCLVRFCARWRIAPLSSGAIHLLSQHWHRVMGGDTPFASAEAENVTETVLKTAALRRLAENPLLLTMLLVVKQGHGRLPPDRVGLYEKAVAVLLDSWNIQGHEPLNLKESVPQLACLAYELLKAGKQTATQREMLLILESARERIPQISRYAQDTPQAFLKRVEFRSSLLVEAGHVMESLQAVPFYQFRHLTFQEYLASVAVVEGYYIEFAQGHSILTPIKEVLLADEWKEVIPMAAVLAKRQSDLILRPLVDDALVAEREYLRSRAAETDRFDYAVGMMPPSVNRILQAIIAEAEIPLELIDDATRLVAFYAGLCSSNDDWKTLARGPYGRDVIAQALSLYKEMHSLPGLAIANTVAILTYLAEPDDFWNKGDPAEVLRRRMESTDIDQKTKALLLVCGSFWQERKSSPLLSDAAIYNEISRNVLHPNPAVWVAASWGLGFYNVLRVEAEMEKPVPTAELLDKLNSLFLEQLPNGNDMVAFAMAHVRHLPRDAWRPILSKVDRSKIISTLELEPITDDPESGYEYAAACIVAYHCPDEFSSDQLTRYLTRGLQTLNGRDLLSTLARNVGVNLPPAFDEPSDVEMPPFNR